MQPPLKATAAQHPEVALVAYHDDIGMQGPPENVTEAFKTLKDQLADVDLRVTDAKTMVYGRDPEAANVVANSTQATFAPSGLVLAGTAIGTAEFISHAVETSCKNTRKDDAAMEECDLPTQHAWTILQGSLQRQNDFVLRVTPWDICKAHLIPLERDIVDATKRVLRLSEGEIQPRHVRQLQLPERLSGFGLVHYTETHANASFVTAAALADTALRDGPRALRPFRTSQAPELWRLYELSLIHI